MSTSKKEMTRRACVAGAAGLVALACPAMALAEEQSGGMALLLPKPAEFVPACIAFVIIFVIMRKFAWPVVLKAMDDRENRIRTDLDDAAKSKETAAEYEREYERRLEDARRQADDIVSEAKREAEAQRSEILAKAQEDAAATIAKAHDAIRSERNKAMIELSGSVVDLSVEIASKIVGDALTEDQQRKLAEKYLAEVGEDNGDES